MTTDRAEQWLAELRELLDFIGGGIARQVETLAASVPNDPMVFAALRAVAAGAKLAGPVPARAAVATRSLLKPFEASAR